MSEETKKSVQPSDDEMLGYVADLLTGAGLVMDRALLKKVLEPAYEEQVMVVSGAIVESIFEEGGVERDELVRLSAAFAIARGLGFIARRAEAMPSNHIDLLLLLVEVAREAANAAAGRYPGFLDEVR